MTNTDRTASATIGTHLLALAALILLAMTVTLTLVAQPVAANADEIQPTQSSPATCALLCEGTVNGSVGNAA